MADEDVKYVDVQPAPDAEISVSTGPLVPADEVDKAKGDHYEADVHEVVESRFGEGEEKEEAVAKGKADSKENADK